MSSAVVSSAFASEPASIDDTLTIKNITRHLEYIEDKNRKLKFNDIVSNQELKWEETGQTYINFGYTKSQYWFRFAVETSPQMTKDWLLEIDFPPIDLIELYIPQEKGKFIKKTFGDTLPFSTREIDDKNYIIEIKRTQGTQTYYFRIDSLDSVNFILNALSYSGYIKRVKNELPVYWFYFGLMMVMVLYHLFIFFTVRDISYIYYVLFITTFALFEFNVKGFAQQHLWPNATRWTSVANPFLVSVTLFCFLLFIYEYWEMRKYFRIKILAIYTIAVPAVILAALSMFVSVSTSLMFVLLFALWVTVFCTSTAIYLSFIHKPYQKEARITLLSFSVFIIAIPVVVLTMQGVLQANFFTRWAMQLGSSVFVIFLSLGLADKIKMMRNSILNAEKKYRHIIESSDDIIFSLNEDLAFLSINTSVKKHLGYKVEDLINTNFLDLIQEAWSKRINIARQLAEEYISDMRNDRKSIEFRTTFQTKYGFEPKELGVKLEYTGSEETGYTILGKASPIIYDTLLQFLKSEEFTYTMNNYLSNAELISQRLTRNLSKYINPVEVPPIRIALRETIINAIEHGNLNITFQEKTESLMMDQYSDLLHERQKDNMLKEKIVTIDYMLGEDRVMYKITDEGEGFDTDAILNTDPSQMNDEMQAHGRGLIMIQDIFDEVSFNNKGNQILLVKFIKN